MISTRVRRLGVVAGTALATPVLTLGPATPAQAATVIDQGGAFCLRI